MRNDSWTNQKSEKYFFCYSEKLSYFLIEIKGLKFITEAIREKDGKKFVLFERSRRVVEALDEYDELKQNGSPRWEQLRAMKNNS
ncbi:hypothetical protein [Bacillus paralicheniformis]|uniref:hypothetical protein n=1 Tax=Bacillus paralicheniformis TaxID=1648923 RepID=UPI00189F2934|nr:hypothetical protein [Bacillus paralicheniformis]